MASRSLDDRVRSHAALADPLRLRIVDELISSDRTSLELQRTCRVSSNLLAYHLDVLEEAGLVSRWQSNGDRRRRYLCLRREGLPEPITPVTAGAEALFVCTENTARSQLAAALWNQITDSGASSAGTHPAEQVHRGALAAGRRNGLDLGGARPRHLDDVRRLPELVVTVCDRAHEELSPPPAWLHWSIGDPVEIGTAAAFDATVTTLRDRIQAIAGTGS